MEEREIKGFERMRYFGGLEDISLQLGLGLEKVMIKVWRYEKEIFFIEIFFILLICFVMNFLKSVSSFIGVIQINKDSRTSSPPKCIQIKSQTLKNP